MERQVHLIDENRCMNAGDGVKEWQAAFDGISEWISIHDRDFKIVRANKALAEALHTTWEALIGEHCYNVICHSNQPCFGCPQKLVLETKSPHVSRVFLPSLGFYSDISIWPLAGADGDVDRTVHLIRDVAQYNTIDIDPTQAGVWFRKLANSLPYLAFELDNSGNLVFANPVLMNITGFSPEDFKSGVNAQQMVDQRDMDKLRNDIFKKVMGIQTGRPEYTLISKKGERIPVEVFAAPILDEDKLPVGLRGIAFDISERRHNEEEVVQNALELDRVFNTAAGAMCIVNKDFSIRRMNNEFAVTFGIDPGTAIQRKCHELLCHICCDRMQCPMSMVSYEPIAAAVGRYTVTTACRVPDRIEVSLAPT